MIGALLCAWGSQYLSQAQEWEQEGLGLGSVSAFPLHHLEFFIDWRAYNSIIKTRFRDFPIALIPAATSCSYFQSTAKLGGQKPASLRALKCSQQSLLMERVWRMENRMRKTQKMLEKVL